MEEVELELGGGRDGQRIKERGRKKGGGEWNECTVEEEPHRK